jgi:hypothetical protein
MQSHNLRNHSSHILTKARTEHNRAMPVRRFRQFINTKMLPLYTTPLAAHLKHLIMETK